MVKNKNRNSTFLIKKNSSLYKFIFLFSICVFLNFSCSKKSKSESGRENENQVATEAQLESEHKFIDGIENDSTFADDVINAEENFLENLTEYEDMNSPLSEEFFSDDLISDDELVGVELKNDVTVETESVEKRLLDSNDRLSRLIFDDEIFIPEKFLKDSSEAVLINSSGQKVFRVFYDDFFRVQRKEIWNIASVKDSKISTLEEFEYFGETLLPKKKSVSSSGNFIVTYFLENSLVEKNETYKTALVKKSEGSEEKIEKKYLSSCTFWKYTDDKKILEERFVSYEYDENGDFEKPKNQTEKRQVFAYHKDSEIPPDYQYFENNVLKIRTIYSSKDDYITDMIFDSGYNISLYYRGGNKIREVFKLNGNVVRSKSYE